MKIFVKTVKDGRYPIDVTSNTKIEEIKGIISKSKMLDGSKMNFIFKGKVLEDKSTVSELHLKENSHIILLLKKDKAPQKLPQESSNKLPNPMEISEMLKNLTKQFAGPKLPEIPAKILEEMMEMGFSESLSKKALYLNDLNTEKAMMWIIDHEQDPNLNSPIPVEQQLSLAKKYSNSQAAAIKECVKSGKCTKCVTGETFAPQVWFMCYTCGLQENQGACESCINICHSGHNISEPIQTSGFYCDCGGMDYCKAFKNNK